MIRKVLMLGVVFLAAVVSTLAYLAWVDSREAGASRPWAPRGVQDALSSVSSSGSEIRLHESDLSRLLVEGLGEHERGARLLELAKDVRAVVDDGRVEVGLVVNLGEVSREELSTEERQAVEKISGYLPFLKDSDLYIGVNGVPTARGGKVTVNRDVKVKLAFLILPVDELGESLGFDAEVLQERLSVDLSPFVAQSVEVLEDEVVISVGTRSR